MTEKVSNNNAEMDSDSRLYELGFHIVPTLGDEGAMKAVEEIRGLIKKNGGAISGEEQAQLMNLAYPLQKDIERKRHTFTTAYFGWVVFESLPNQAHAVKEAMRSNKDVVRFLLIKTVAGGEQIKHPARVSRAEAKPKEEVKERVIETAKKTPEKTEETKPMSKEKMDEEIEKLIVD